MRELVAAQAPRLYALGLRFCGSPQEAEDLVQETFLQAYRHWDGFEERSSPATWLYTIASRVCQRFHRKRSGEPDRIASFEELLPSFDPDQGGPMGVAPEDDDPLAATIRSESRERLEQAIAELPLDFRMPLVLKELVGLSVREVAQALGLEEATVKTRLHRARLKLRRALEEGLPQRDVPPPAYSRQVCLDLLQAKQDALDNDRPFRFPEGLVCERCAELFATLDLAQSLCHEVGRGELPAPVRAALLERLESASKAG